MIRLNVDMIIRERKINLKILTKEDIKFDEDHMYIASHTNLYENLQENLSEAEFNIYMSHLVFLEHSLEHDLVNEEDQVFTFVELEDVIRVSNTSLETAEDLYENLLEKGYIREDMVEDRLAKYFLY